MTRLKSQDLEYLVPKLEDYSNELEAKTGFNLNEIAAYANGLQGPVSNPSELKVAVIPLTCGQGVIEGFSQAVAGICRYLWFDTFVTEKPDAGGLAEAVAKGAQIIFTADDERFVAVNLKTGKAADNSAATGRGYAAALKLMCGGLEEKYVLLIGAGQVGKSAAMAMIAAGARLGVYDINQQASYQLASDLYLQFGCLVTVEIDLEAALECYRIIFDASPAPPFLEARHLKPETVIAAPGIPLGIHPECLEQLYYRVVHDPLQIGVATMLFEVCGK